MTAQWRQFQVGAVFACVLLLWGQRGVFFDDDATQQLREEYAIVRPLCFLCQSEGKTPFGKMPTIVNENIAVLNTFYTHYCTFIFNKSQLNKGSKVNLEIWFFSPPWLVTPAEKNL